MTSPDPGVLGRAAVRSIYEITVGGVLRTVRVARLGAGACDLDTRYGVQLDDGVVHIVDASRPVPDVLSMLVQDAAWEAGLVAASDGFQVELRGVRHDVEVVDPRRKALRLAGASGASGVKTAMPGRIVRVLVAKGDHVSKGQPVLVVEAMKMENELEAPRDGVVRTLLVASGDLVETGAVLLELDPLVPRE